MTWMAPIVGYVDSLGYIRCSECAEESHRHEAVSGDQWFSAHDRCERCRKPFERVPSSAFVLVANGYSAPDMAAQTVNETRNAFGQRNNAPIDSISF